METVIFVGAVVIFLFGLVSARAGRLAITPPMVFVTVGLLLGVLGFEVSLESGVLKLIAEITLVLILFTDASTLRIQAVRRNVGTPVRLLGIGLPLTMLAGLGVGLLVFPEMDPWVVAIMAFILSPTDAALGQEVVTSDAVPEQVRDSIEVESGLNDGIALPPIMACVAVCAAAAAGGESGGVMYWLGFAGQQIMLGPVAGCAVGLVGGWLLSMAVKKGWVVPAFQRMASVALALTTYAVAEQLGGNGFIAAFFGGLMLAVRQSDVRRRLRDFGEAEGQLLELLVFLLFGVVMIPVAREHWDAWAVLYAALSLTVIRMVPVILCLAGTGFDLATKGFIAWFGPRGIASILYLLLILEELGLPGYERMASVIVLTVLGSVFLHGLSAVPLCRMYGRHQEARRG